MPNSDDFVPRGKVQQLDIYFKVTYHGMPEPEWLIGTELIHLSVSYIRSEEKPVPIFEYSKDFG
jgi:hypothetical protein